MASPALLLLPLSLALAVLWLFRRRQSHGPPIVPYFIPWLGSSVAMANDPDAFFTHATKVHGPVFGVKTAGSLRYFVTSPTLAKQIHKQSKQFIFTPYRIEMSSRVFGQSMETIEQTGLFADEFFEMVHRLLSPSVILQGLIPTYAKYVTAEVSAYNPPSDPIPARDLLYNMLYRASAHTFFGPTFDSAGTVDAFIAFDRMFPLLSLELPWPLNVPAIDARTKITKLLETYSKGSLEGMSDYMQYVISRARERNAEDQVAPMCLTVLWALEANAPLAAYWAIVLSLCQPEGLAPLIAEVDAERVAWEAANPTLSLAKDPDSFVIQARLPLLNSVIQETLRYTTSSFSIRRVMEPVTLAGYHFTPGQELVINGRYTQVDEEYYDDPDTFVPTRFVEQKSSTKNTTGFMAPFGGGVSMCEGRHFAQTEMKVFICLLLTQLDISLAPDVKKSDAVLDRTRIGLGVIHPKGDVMLSVRRRVT